MRLGEERVGWGTGGVDTNPMVTECSICRRRTVEHRECSRKDFKCQGMMVDLKDLHLHWCGLELWLRVTPPHN